MQLSISTASLYAVFEDIVIDSDATVKKLGLSKKAGEALVHIAHESVKIPKVEVTGELVLMLHRARWRNDHTKCSQKRRANQRRPGADIELLYLGAPIYRIKVTASDYKKAEKALEKAANAAIAVLEKSGGEAKLIKKPKSGKSQ